MKRPLLVPIALFLCSSSAFLLDALFRARVLPFLHAETILSRGREISTQEFVRLMSKGFDIAGALTIALGLTALLTLLAANRQRSGKRGAKGIRGPHSEIGIRRLESNLKFEEMIYHLCI